MHEASYENKCYEYIIDCVTFFYIKTTVAMVSKSLNCCIDYENNVQDYML
jgi:hypothetical protein